MKGVSIETVLTEWMEEIQASLIDSKAVYLALFTIDGKLVFANPNMTRLFKKEPVRNLINPTFDELVCLDCKKSLIYRGFLTIGDYYTVNISMYSRIFRKNDRLLIIGDFDALQLTEQNEVMHHLNREINDLQRQLIKKKHHLECALKDLNDANCKLEELNATKDKFFSIIAHDLRNPFNSIIGFCSLLQEQIRQKDYESLEEYVEIIANSSEKTLALLINLLEWAQSQTGKMEFKPEEIDMMALVTEAVDLAKDYAGQKSISILKELPENALVYADKAMISTILRNLISNALKFTEDGGTVVVSVEFDANEMYVAVADNGVGMTKDTLDKLFNIEENHSTAGTHNEKGTGLGLILCQEFVAKHGGNIRVESEPGKGSKFIFSLPMVLK